MSDQRLRCGRELQCWHELMLLSAAHQLSTVVGSLTSPSSTFRMTSRSEPLRQPFGTIGQQL
jgi:hypothetical protein